MTAEEALELGVEPGLWEERYWMIQCCGCNGVSFRCDSRDMVVGEEAYTVYYPPRIARRLPEWRHHLRASIRGLVEEVYAALAAQCPTLATMGARTLVDMVVVKLVGDVGPFRAKLEALEERGLIGRIHREQLQSALDAGSAAAHRGFIPSADAVNQVMDIVENLLQAVYILPGVARKLKRGTPKRRLKRRRQPAV